MDKFRSTHDPGNRQWRAVEGEIKKQKPTAFQKKLKKLLQDVGLISNQETTIVMKPQASLSFDRSSKKVQHDVEVEVSDKTDSLLSSTKERKKRKRKSKNSLNCNSSAGKKDESIDYCSEKTTAHGAVEDRLKAQNFVYGYIFNQQKREDEARKKSLFPRDLCVSSTQTGNPEDKCVRHEQNNNFFIKSVGEGSDFAVKKLLKKHRKERSVTGNIIDKSKDITTKNCEYENTVLEGTSEYSGLSARESLDKNELVNNKQNKGCKRKHKRGNSTISQKIVKDGHCTEVSMEINTDNVQTLQSISPLIGEVDRSNSCTKTDIELQLKAFYDSLKSDIESNTPDVDTSSKMQGNKTWNVSSSDEVNETLTSITSHSGWETSLQTEPSFCNTSEIGIEAASVRSSEMETGSGGFKIEEINIEASSVVVHKLPHREQFLVLMKHPNTVFFKGRLTISVLMGAVEVLGCILSKETRSKQTTVYSPKGSSMLSIETCLSSPPNSLDYEIMNDTLVEFGIELSKDIIADVEKRDCVVLLEVPPVSPLEKFLETMPSQMQLFKFSHKGRGNIKNSPFYEIEDAFECVFSLPHAARRLRKYHKGAEWHPVASAISEGPKRTIVCGGKGVGKSTFLRFLVNQFLPVFGEVLCLDFDPGQSEFTVPGCVSAVIIKEPLLGPNFTHLAVPERMVNVGEVNIGQCPVQYVESVQHIISFCSSKPELVRMPWIVNTMGFNKGIGVDLTTTIIRLLRPHHVVQIQSAVANLNFRDLLGPLFVHNFESRFCKRAEPFDYVLHVMNTMAEDKKTSSPWGMDASQLRETMILSYLSPMVRPPNFSVIDLVPYITPFSKLILCVCHAKVPYSQMLSAMNGNLVALCSYDGKDALMPDDPELPSVLGQQPVCPCLGFGIVRGIDMEKKQLLLITPLQESLLSQVNCLMLGAVTLPDCIYGTANQCEGQIPYMATGPGQPTSKVTRRFFRPLQRLQGRMRKRKHWR